MGNISDGVFLNCDGKKLYYAKPEQILPVNKYHSPYCLLLCDNNIDSGGHRDSTEAVISQIEEKVQEAREEEYDPENDNPYKFVAVDKQGRLKYANPRVYRSFHNPNVRYRCIEVHTTKSWKVPPLSDALFRDFGYYTAEFDIPYRDRAMIDLQGDNRLWIFDTGGEVCELKVLAYDIETTEYVPSAEEENPSFPIDMVGWSSISIHYRAKRDMKTGRCEFEVLSMPDWNEPKIHQLVAHNLDEEIELLMHFIDLVYAHHIIAGHNIMQFDNKQIYDRLQFLLAGNQIPREHINKVKMFVDRNNPEHRAVPTKIFFYGDMQTCVEFFPLSFDTLFAAKRIFFFLGEYNLKSLAKTFGYVIPDRLYLDAEHMSILTPEEEKLTLKYNEHDVREQLGVTLHLLPDAMRLCHLTGMSFTDCMPAGTTKIWDYMTHIRAHQKRKIMPAIAPAMTIAGYLFHRFGEINPKTKKPYTKPELAELARKSLDSTDPIAAKPLKILKYGVEAPDYVMYPHLLYNPYQKEVLHTITTPKCGCKECKKNTDLKYCKCAFCKSVRNQFPDGLNDKDDQVEFIIQQMKSNGHTENDEMLMHYASSGRGFRNNKNGYHFPGGLTLHPTYPNINSHFKMWWNIIVADVGAMYPNNVRAENIGGDTTRFANVNQYEFEAPNTLKPKRNSPHRFVDETYKWVWIKRIRYDIVKNFFVAIGYKDLHSKPEYKALSEEYSFVDDGYLVGIVVDNELGGISEAMAAVLDITAAIKKQKAEVSRPGSGASEMLRKQVANAYQSMKGLRNSGTHGVITAPTVSCRQFNLAGGSRITTLGQCVLDDTMKMLDAVNARKVYGDTDGIYLAASKDARSVYDSRNKIYPYKEMYGLDGEGSDFMEPSLIEQTIDHINKKWQAILNYDDYELEIEEHDGMMFVRHKNYLIFDHDVEGDDIKLKFKSKGNNFKAKDKAKIATDLLQNIVVGVSKKHAIWEDEEKEFTEIRSDIKTTARTLVEGLNVDEMGIPKFSFRQNISPMSAYKQQERTCPSCNGSGCEFCANTGLKLSVYAARSNAMEKLLGLKFRSNLVMQCVVCVNPLPAIDKPKKSGTKPLAFMWPVDSLDDTEKLEQSGGIDYDWYKDMVFNYIKGAFGFDTWNINPWVCVMKQMTLDGSFTVKIVSGDKFKKDGVFAQGKTINCDKDMFDNMKKGEPIPDDAMEVLVNTELDDDIATHDWEDGSYEDDEDNEGWE